MRTIFFFLVLIMLISNISFANTFNCFHSPEATVCKDSTEVIYLIDNKIVSKVAFDSKIKNLEEITGTWYCAETTDGGITGYDAKDSKGDVFEVRYELVSGMSKNIIRKK